MKKRSNSILVIDDDKSILQIFTRILQRQGYDIDTAETGQEALDKLQKKGYDLALTDVKLPDLNGIDLLAKMHAARPDMVMIAITGLPSLEDATKAIDRGAAAYLVKPIKPEDLLRLVAEKLSR